MLYELYYMYRGLNDGAPCINLSSLESGIDVSEYIFEYYADELFREKQLCFALLQRQVRREMKVAA